MLTKVDTATTQLATTQLTKVGRATTQLTKVGRATTKLTKVGRATHLAN